MALTHPFLTLSSVHTKKILEGIQVTVNCIISEFPHLCTLGKY